MAIDVQKITARRRGGTSAIQVDRPDVQVKKRTTMVQWVKAKGETFSFVGLVPSYSSLGPIAVTADLITLTYSGRRQDEDLDLNYTIVAQTSTGVLLSSAKLPVPPPSGPTIRNH